MSKLAQASRRGQGALECDRVSPHRKMGPPTAPRAEDGRAAETDTRGRVIRAAVDCIIDLGFYRGSSTNEIARRAGVTWGVIQHYFGTREGLMLAVLEDGAAHMVSTVETPASTVPPRRNGCLSSSTCSRPTTAGASISPACRSCSIWTTTPDQRRSPQDDDRSCRAVQRPRSAAPEGGPRSRRRTGPISRRRSS